MIISVQMPSVSYACIRRWKIKHADINDYGSTPYKNSHVYPSYLLGLTVKCLENRYSKLKGS